MASSAARQRARDLDQFLVSRKLVDPGQAVLRALDVGPTYNSVPVHQELAGELDLTPLEFRVLARRRRETVQPADGIASLVVRHPELQLPRQIPIGTVDRLHDLGRDA